MGIKGLNNIIKKYSPECVTLNDISKYNNKKLAIDSSILLYKFKYANKAENSHILGIINRIKFYMMNNILPVFIFDGTPCEAKKICTISKRHANREKTYVRLEELRSISPKSDDEKQKIDEEIEKISSQMIIIKKHHIDECKELLRLSGIPYLTAPDDAEKYCAFLQENGMVDYTVSDDTDAITFGCK